jgi:hypothetical protein
LDVDLGFETGEGRTHISVRNLIGFSRAEPFQQKKVLLGELVTTGLTTVAKKGKVLEIDGTERQILLLTN